MVTEYDEFGMLRDNAEEAGIPWDGPPRVERRAVPVEGGREVSALVWGEADPEVVLIHGGAQNAHTWDTVALALARPLVAPDMPGHGRSSWREDHSYWPPGMVEDLATAVRELAPAARMVVGMSLGGLTAISMAARHPDLVKSLVVVDVTPGTDHSKAEPIVAFISGPETFESFDEILERTIRYNPTRTESSLRRGVLHNARQLPDGRWTWRYDRFRGPSAPEEVPDFSALWSDVDAIEVPLMLVRGGLSGVVGDEDVDELLRRQPGARLVVVEGAGHSIQGDRPVELAGVLEEFLDRTG